jgi:hypothetical protein
MNIESILVHYAVCALWSSIDDGEPLDSTYSVSDIAPSTLGKMRDDVKAFVESNQRDLSASGQSDAQIGHDFWLTRNGHGTGFWDRGLGVIGERLTAACKKYGEIDLYVGDDNFIHH